jgi:hypothetical protein
MWLRIVQNLIAIAGLLALAAALTAQEVPPSRSLPFGVVDVTPPDLPSRPSMIRESTAETPEIPQWGLSAEYLLAFPKRADMDYAIPDATNNKTPEGTIQSLDWGASSGVRAALTYRPTGSLVDTAFSYTYIGAGSAQSAFAPIGGLLYPTQTRPGLVDSATTATATGGMAYNVWDLTIGRFMPLEDYFLVRWSAGARVAYVNQNFNVLYNGLQATFTNVLRANSFIGGGLVAAAEGRWTLPNDFIIYGKAGGALVGGGQYSNLLETDIAGAIVNANLTDRYWQVVPVMEMSFGITWQRYGYQIGVGYEMSNWFKLVNRTTLVDTVSEGKFVRQQTDLTIQAIVFRFTKTF